LLCSVLIKFPRRTRGEHHPRALRRRKKNAARGKTSWALPSLPGRLLSPPSLRRLLIPVVLRCSKWICRSSCPGTARQFRSCEREERDRFSSIASRGRLLPCQESTRNSSRDNGRSVFRAFPYLASTVFQQTVGATHVGIRCLKLVRANAVLIASNIAAAPSMRPPPPSPPARWRNFVSRLSRRVSFQSRMISLFLSLSLSLSLSYEVALLHRCRIQESRDHIGDSSMRFREGSLISRLSITQAAWTFSVVIIYG